MKILITGGSGFLGKTIVRKFASTEEVDTLGRSASNEVKTDLTTDKIDIIKKYDVVIHCAGKAHSDPQSELEKKEYYEVNYLGTVRLLKSISNNPPSQFVFISSMAVYGLEEGIGICEINDLTGFSPYAKSKILAEVAIKHWCEQHQVRCLILRLPLIVGEHPPGNLGKMIDGIKSKKYLSVNKGRARRSVVLSEDVANCIYDNYQKSGIYNLTDGIDASFREIEAAICEKIKSKLPIALPFWAGKILGKVGDVVPKFPVNSKMIQKMSTDLTFDDSKAVKELVWKPRSVLAHFPSVD
ncbi:MAG: NAD-dependent epimerase/dehydratase family protein [Cyclobacteriaceae bacterium]